MGLFPMCLAVGIIIGKGIPIMGTAFHLLNLVALIGLGMLILFVHRIQFTVVVVAVGLMGLVLGYRSGIDMAAAQVKMQFIPGVALTGFIAMTLIAAWVPKADTGWQRTLRQAAGVCFAAAGLIFLSNLLFGGSESMARAISMPSDENLTLMLQQKQLTPLIFISLLIGAVGWGAAHAFTPGHGKAIVGAYLVGARANAWHAFYLGLTVTATHTLGVFTLGLLTLFASRYIVVDDLYPWLGTISGFLVLAIGIHMLTLRWKVWRNAAAHDHNHHDDHGHDHHHSHEHDHDHQHRHDHPHNHDHDHGPDHHHGHGHTHLPPGADGTPVTWKSLLALGVSGGILPCPAALILLLAAVSQHRTALGLALVVAFSLGLAGILTVVGLLFVKGGRVFEQSPKTRTLTRFLPVVSSLAISVLGALITVQSAWKISF
jgi:ABC-type nickel/cobalt efflux system permease component RcnA